MKELLRQELARSQEYWHVTNLAAFAEIVRDREIRAMPEGRSVHKFKTAARYLGGVSMFDFNSPQIANAENLGGGHHWDFFKKHPMAMAIGIDPRRLHGEVLSFPENRHRTDQATTGQNLQLPLLIEVIHVGPIPARAWTRYLRVQPDFAFEEADFEAHHDHH